MLQEIPFNLKIQSASVTWSVLTSVLVYLMWDQTHITREMIDSNDGNGRNKSA